MRNNLPPQLQLTHLDHGLFEHLGHQPLLLVKFDISKFRSRCGISKISTFIDVLNAFGEIMLFNQFEYEFVQEKIEAMPTSELHLLKARTENKDYASCPAKDDLLSIIELELKKRRQQAQIEKLNKSLKASNPLGRVISGVTGFFIRSSRKS